MKRTNIERQPYFPMDDLNEETATALRRRIERVDIDMLHDDEVSLLHNIGHASIAAAVRNYLNLALLDNADEKAGGFSRGFGAYEVFASTVGNAQSVTRSGVIKASQAFIHRLRDEEEILNILSRITSDAHASNPRAVALLAHTAQTYREPQKNLYIAGGSTALAIDIAARIPEL